MTNPSASSLVGKFIWYDQMSNDLPGAEKFYSKVVGWTIAPNAMNAQRYSLLKSEDAMVGGLMPIPEEAAKMGVRPAWMGYIAVDDVKAYADKVKAAGGAIHRPPTEIPNVGTFAIAGDPSGAGCCSKAIASRRRSRIRRSPAMSAGTSCTAAIRKSPSPSIPACSAGQKERRSTWGRWGPTRSSPPRGSRPAA